MQRLLPKLVCAGNASSANASQHSQRLHVGFQDGLRFRALIGVLLAQAHDGAQRLDVEAVALGFGIDVADIVRDRLLFFFQAFDTLDDGLELVFGEFRRGLFLDGGGGGGHRVLLNGTDVAAERSSAARFPARRFSEMTLQSAAACVKATSRSSTARPQEKGMVPGHFPSPLVRRCLRAAKAGEGLYARRQTPHPSRTRVPRLRATLSHTGEGKGPRRKS